MTTASVDADTAKLSVPDFLFKLLPLVIGLLVVYIPSYLDLAQGSGQADDDSSGPFLFGFVVLVLLALRRDELREPRSRPAGWWAWPMLVFGLVLFAVGRSQTLPLLEIGSQSLVLGGGLMIVLGRGVGRVIWFPLLFLCFMVPLPGVMVDAVTSTLKVAVSEWAENILYWAGWPVGRSGVTLSIGSYRLEVANACSGLRSMFALFAVGTLYTYIMGYRSWFRIVLLLGSGFPIAFLANVVRVMVLVLVTYYFGDEAGQGFIHKFAGMLLYLVALIGVFAVDHLYGMIAKRINKGSV